MEDLIFKLIDLADQIEKDETKQLLYAYYESGKGLDYVRWLEQEKNLRFNDEIKNFYADLNCFQLMWIDKNNPEFDADKHVFSPDPFSFDLPRKQELEIDGCINIWPLGDVLNESWEESVYIDSEREIKLNYNQQETTLLELKKKFLPFDLFSKEECIGFFSSNNDNNVNSIIMGSDYYSSIRYSKSCSLSNYLEELIQSKGAIDYRRKLFDGSKAFEFSPLSNQ